MGERTSERVSEWAELLAVVQADALGYLCAAQGAVLQSVAAHQAAAHVAAGQEDRLSLQTNTRTGVIGVAGESTSPQLVWTTKTARQTMALHSHTDT